MDAFSLPAVVVISTLVMLLILFAFSLRTLDFQHHDIYRDLKQDRLDHQSAAALYMCDSTLLAGRDSTSVVLYGDGEAPIGVRKQNWGLFEAVSICRGADDPFGRTYLMGRADECSTRAAFWLSDRNIPLTLAGRTSLKGQVCLPHAGLKYLDLAEDPFRGDSLSSNQMRASRRYMPRLSEGLWACLDTLKGMRGRSVPFRENAFISFEEPALSMCCSSRKAVTLRLGGHIVLFGDRLVLSGDSELHDILIVARTVVIENGFRGSAQIFCADSIVVKSHVALQYPSGLFVGSSGQNAPGIIVGEGSTVEGYVGIHWGEKYHYVLESPCFCLQKGALVRGLVYADGSCNINGATIRGAAYLRDCFYRDARMTYAGTMHDVTVERSDSLAFPILLEGPYKRKMIKHLY